MQRRSRRGVPLQRVGRVLKTFIQPDGGGGNFGAAVAGTENTALIGAAGANLGTGGAGAAYLFDADPTSPTFGQAIAAVQEPTPDTRRPVRHGRRLRQRGLDRRRRGAARDQRRGERRSLPGGSVRTGGPGERLVERHLRHRRGTYDR